MNDQPSVSKPAGSGSDPDDNPPRSPIRPVAPAASPLADRAEPVRDDLADVNDPHLAIAILRRKMETVATEFAEGRINRAQFNAMYGRYSEQRAIIERIIERNPYSKAWKQVIGTAGHTNFLREHFEAHPLFFLVYRHRVPEPLMVGGKTAPDMALIAPILKALWTMPKRPPSGLARKLIGEHQWLVLALGENALTIVVFLLEPAASQAALIRDMHADFERANQAALTRPVMHTDRMVFPQRALTESEY